MAENFFGVTDTGKVRGNNEDAFIAQKAMNDTLIIACVIDGVGGYSGGEVAADIARQSILEHISRPASNIVDMMKEALDSANERIFSERQQIKKHESMACVLTFAAVDIENNQLYYAHVGDTRLYLFRDNSLVKISKDHSFVGFMEESGRLSEEAAMRHPKRNEINKALGFGSDIQQSDYIETGQSPFLPGDTILLCSDGLTDMVDRKGIISVLVKPTSLEEKATELVEEANNKGGKDNITVVLVKNDKVPVKQKATRPSLAEKKKILAKADEQPVPANDKVQDHRLTLTQTPQKKYNALLLFFCILFLASTVWLLWQRQRNSDKIIPTETAVVKVRSAEEIKLQSLLDSNFTGNMLLLDDSIFSRSIRVSDTLRIQQDTLFIKTKGTIVLQRDSSYTGPAIKLSPGCKLIMLDSLEFKDFDVAVHAVNNALFLKNIRFINCRVPMINIFTFPVSSLVTGRITNNSFSIDTVKLPGK